MRETAAFPDAVLIAGMVLAAALAAGAVLGRTVRGRAWAMLGALVLTPVLLLAEIWESPQLESVRDRGPLALVAAAVGLAAMGALAFLFARRPAVLGVAALAALPFRVPGAVGREHGQPARAALRRDRRGRAGVADPAALRAPCRRRRPRSARARSSGC